MRLTQLIFFFLYGMNTYSQCEGLEKGTFMSIDSLAGKTMIYRWKNLQLEENKNLGFKSIEKLKWDSPCNYTIYEFDILVNEGKITEPSGNFIVEVEKLNDSVYSQTVFIEKFNFTHKSKITKISNEISSEFKEILKKESR